MEPGANSFPPEGLDDAGALRDHLRSIQEKLDKVTSQIASLTKQRRELREQYQETETKLLALCLASNSQSCGSSSSPYDQSTGFPWSEELQRVSKETFHITSFRPLQLRAINATLDDKDLILVMPTGAGKSLVYQLPAFVQRKQLATCSSKTQSSLYPVTLVISPLVSLMNDQAMGLTQLGIAPGSVTVFDASTPLPEQRQILDYLSGKANKCCESVKKLRLLYVTPEKLSKSKRLLNSLEAAYAHGRLDRIAIDEVHCVSQWGHDFRPDYQFLHVLRRQFPKVPIVGLTATASADVIVDIQSMLGLNSQSCLVIRSGYNRKNLLYEVRIDNDATKKPIDSLYNLIKTKYLKQCGIVYCFSQKDTEDVASGLRKCGIKAACYHANLEAEYRSRVHAQWYLGEIHVMVATVAFGMGIDKPDVHFVIHYSSSKSLENYYQESGRAGRDGNPAECVILWRFPDLFRLASMVSSERTGLSKLMHMVNYCIDPVTCRRKLLAQHLADTTWTQDDCPGACDNCRRRLSSNEDHLVHLNISTLLEETEALLTEHMARKQERVTGPKLVELMSSNRGIQQTAASLFGRSPVRVFYEHFVAWSLVNRWLKLEFHYTPYSTVCYVVPVDRRVEDSGDLFMPYLVLNGKRKQKQEPNGDATKKRRKTEVFDMQSVETVELDSD